jgi:hypothetical protein
VAEHTSFYLEKKNQTNSQKSINGTCGIACMREHNSKAAKPAHFQKALGLAKTAQMPVSRDLCLTW